MTTTLSKPRTASIIVDTDGDGFKIQHMYFDGDMFEAENNVHLSETWNVSRYITGQIHARSHRPTTVFITISAAKRMTDEQIAAIQQSALETRT